MGGGGGSPQGRGVMHWMSRGRRTVIAAAALWMVLGPGPLLAQGEAALWTETASGRE